MSRILRLNLADKRETPDFDNFGFYSGKFPLQRGFVRRSEKPGTASLEDRDQDHSGKEPSPQPFIALGIDFRIRPTVTAGKVFVGLSSWSGIMDLVSGFQFLVSG